VVARAHGLIIALVAAGAALRLIVWLAYEPALIYFDSYSYLEEMNDLTPGETRPLGYPVFLRLLPMFGELSVIPAVQHLMGLGIGVAIYVLLVRLDLSRWGAALAAAPVLLDAYQLNIEEYILSETLYQALLIAACALILWRPVPTPALAAGAGLVLAAATLTRASGLLVIAPAVLAVVFLARRPAPVLALVLAFTIPVCGYAAWVNSVHGSFAVTTYGGRFLYARVAPFADCSKFDVKPYERPLCEPEGERLSIERYMWNRRQSPIFKVDVPPGMTLPEVGGDFARKVILHQPGEYLERVTHDILRGFYPTRTRHEGELPISRWHFQEQFPIYRPESRDVLRRYGHEDGEGEVKVGLARVLRAYQAVGYVPNLLLGLGLVLALVSAFLRGRERRLRGATLLFVAMAVVVLFPTAAANQFTWRYQLPQLVLLPVAAALGVRLSTMPAREDPRSRR
jgi:hypothetical protein